MTNIAANCSLLFREYPLLERPKAARDAGFDAIELWWPFPTATATPDDVEALGTAIENSGLPLVGLNFFAGNMADGDRGLVSWTGREGEFRDNVDIVVTLAERLGTRAFNALYGNSLEGVEPGAQRATALANLEYAANAVAPFGGVVLLEPVSGAPRYPLLTAADVVSVIEQFEAESSLRNLALLADVYHLTVNGDDTLAALNAYRDRIGHVQFADVPGRHEPGTGALDLTGIRQTLTDIGYTSWLAAEYVPMGPTAEGLDWLRNW